MEKNQLEPIQLNLFLEGNSLITQKDNILINATKTLDVVTENFEENEMKSAKIIPITKVSRREIYKEILNRTMS